MLGMRVVAVKCTKAGDVDIEDLRKLAEKHKDKLSAAMVTYPSTHGVFEQEIREICQIVHDNGGLVYMDGANLQAQVGYCSPGDIGADVCHLNLHKTFCIPHGGGGPGLGPIAVNEKLAPFLPQHSDDSEDIRSMHKDAVGAVSGAKFSSASIATIPWMYIRMMGVDGIRNATAMSIANANYLRKRLCNDFEVLYTGESGFCAHEFIIDMRGLKKKHGITAEDLAKRLMDYGFHAPTMSFPVADTLMVEPTESEPLSELDRLCDAMLSIREEIREIEEGKVDIESSVLRNAPHTIDMVSGDEWGRAYSREKASCIGFFAERGQSKLSWPTVGRADNAYGDMPKNHVLVCPCPTVEELAENM
jgi:glycine dehydrogenase